MKSLWCRLFHWRLWRGYESEFHKKWNPGAVYIECPKCNCIKWFALPGSNHWAGGRYQSENQ